MYNARLEFVPIIRRIDATDSYQAEKAGNLYYRIQNYRKHLYI